jgi:hypothetical protein
LWLELNCNNRSSNVFYKKQRLTVEYFEHDEHPVWCVFYPATSVKPAHWQGYKAFVEELVSDAGIPASELVQSIKGGDEIGFASQEECEKACLSAIGKL